MKQCMNHEDFNYPNTRNILAAIQSQDPSHPTLHFHSVDTFI